MENYLPLLERLAHFYFVHFCASSPALNRQVALSSSAAHLAPLRRQPRRAPSPSSNREEETDIQGAAEEKPLSLFVAALIYFAH